LSSALYRGALRGELGLGNGTRLVGIVGRMFPIKNHRLFLDAAARVAGAEKHARFVVVGDGLLRPEMEAHAGAWHRDRVVFMAGGTTCPGSIRSRRAGGVSKNEGTPVSAIGPWLGALRGRGRWPPDLIDDGRPAASCRRRTPALAAAILRMLRDPDAGKSARLPGAGP
jgi:hypothetical protein